MINGDGSCPYNDSMPKNELIEMDWMDSGKKKIVWKIITATNEKKSIWILNLAMIHFGQNNLADRLNFKGLYRFLKTKRPELTSIEIIPAD